jgi:hypothetical protein
MMPNIYYHAGHYTLVTRDDRHGLSVVIYDDRRHIYDPQRVYSVAQFTTNADVTAYLLTMMRTLKVMSDRRPAV